ncbi:GNAT family N-acetyltransferase [Sphingomonas sp. UYP23]
MASPVAITAFSAGSEADVVALIVGIQAGEFGIPITAADQPDLADIPGFYQSGAGGFWTAVAGGEIVGTIALRDCGGGLGALRKMFVAPAWRGRAHGVGAALLAQLLAHARAVGLETVMLGTTAAFVGAHRFYEKNGFVEISLDTLPPSFPRMPLDTKFYRLTLGGAA